MTTTAAGYKFEDVAKVNCLMCSQPIGEFEYQEVTILARFGQMLFEHTKCPELTK